MSGNPVLVTPPKASARTTRRPRASTEQRRQTFWGWVFSVPHTAGLVLFTVVASVATAAVSLFDWPLLSQPTFIGLDNYVALVESPVFSTVIRNTVVFVLLYVPLNLVISLGLAAWLTPKIKYRHAFRIVFFIPVVTPLLANVVVWRMVYQPGGFIDAVMQGTAGVPAPNFLAEEQWAMLAIVTMSVWHGFGYNMLIFSAALDAVPDEQLEAAQIDGAGAWRIFWNIKLPAISPMVFFASTLTIISAFQVFVQPFVLTKGGPGDSTMTLLLFIYNQGFQFHRLGLAAAAAWVLFVIILGVTIVHFRGQRRWVHYD